MSLYCLSPVVPDASTIEPEPRSIMGPAATSAPGAASIPLATLRWNNSRCWSRAPWSISANASHVDEVHKGLIAKNVLARYHSSLIWNFGN